MDSERNKRPQKGDVRFDFIRVPSKKGDKILIGGASALDGDGKIVSTWPEFTTNGLAFRHKNTSTKKPSR